MVEPPYASLAIPTPRNRSFCSTPVRTSVEQQPQATCEAARSGAAASARHPLFRVACAPADLQVGCARQEWRSSEGLGPHRFAGGVRMAGQ